MDRGRQSLTLPHIPSLLQFLLSLSVASSSTCKSGHNADQRAFTNKLRFVIEIPESPYLLPPLQFTENSLKALVHVVKLNSSQGQQAQRQKGGGGLDWTKTKQDESAHHQACGWAILCYLIGLNLLCSGLFCCVCHVRVGVRWTPRCCREKPMVGMMVCDLGSLGYDWNIYSKYQLSGSLNINNQFWQWKNETVPCLNWK